MLPELKFKVAFPGFGTIELKGECVGKEESFQEVTIRFVPSEPCEDKSGLVIKLLHNGDCYTQELRPLTKEEAFEGMGIA
jgi:hypothetical protein